jgi:hypothetical protein
MIQVNEIILISDKGALFKYAGLMLENMPKPMINTCGSFLFSKKLRI